MTQPASPQTKYSQRSVQCSELDHVQAFEKFLGGLGWLVLARPRQHGAAGAVEVDDPRIAGDPIVVRPSDLDVAAGIARVVHPHLRGGAVSPQALGLGGHGIEGGENPGAPALSRRKVRLASSLKDWRSP